MNNEILKKIPKVDLHCHLDGSIRTGTILDLARAVGHKLPADTVEELRPYVRVPEGCRSLGEFLERFETFYPLLKNPQALERISYELLRDTSAENMKYLEIRFAPVLQKDEGFSIPAVIESVLKGIERGEKEFPVRCGVILCLYRGTTLEDSLETARSAVRYRDYGVCGVDVAGDESRYGLSDFRKPVEICREGGLSLTVHAGEAGGPENIKQALELGADRIGHGVALIKDPALMEEVAEKKIPLEICITSNVQTQVVEDYSEHPFLKLIDSGVRVTLNTDDRGVSGIDMTYEYSKALELGLSPEGLEQVILEGASAAFLPEGERKRLRKEIQEELERVIR